MKKEKIQILGFNLPGWAAQFSRFFVVGVVNTVLDVIILVSLSYLTGWEKGIRAGGIKAVSFTIVSIFSFFANQKWTFKQKVDKAGKEIKEYSQFLTISLGGLIINSSLVALITKFIPPLHIQFIIDFQFSQKLWLVFASLVATAVSLVWNFLGYKFIVFKK